MRLEINVEYRVLAEHVNIGIGIVGKLFHVEPYVVIVNGLRNVNVYRGLILWRFERALDALVLLPVLAMLGVVYHVFVDRIVITLINV